MLRLRAPQPTSSTPEPWGVGLDADTAAGTPGRGLPDLIVINSADFGVYTPNPGTLR